MEARPADLTSTDLIAPATLRISGSVIDNASPCGLIDASDSVGPSQPTPQIRLWYLINSIFRWSNIDPSLPLCDLAPHLRFGLPLSLQYHNQSNLLSFHVRNWL